MTVTGGPRDARRLGPGWSDVRNRRRVVNTPALERSLQMIRTSMLLAVVGCALFAAPTWTQAQQNRDPAAFRERMMNGIKERMAATDDEWKVLQPKIEKVMTAQRNARGGGFGGFGG